MEGEEGEVVREMVIKKVDGLAVFMFLSWGNTSCSLWVLITASNITNSIGSIVRVIIRIDGRIIIVKIMIKPISTKLERK